ncbi:MAG: (d)CMP kinase, partial [Hungatella sp.]
NVTDESRLPIVSRHTSDVACIRAVREILVKQQQAIAGNRSVIMDGRDIGSVVLPHADFKFYLDASIEERAERRMKDFINKGIEKCLEDVKEDIAQRDYNDSHREESPLICAEDAIVVDTTGKNIQEVCEIITHFIEGGHCR